MSRLHISMVRTGQHESYSATEEPYVEAAGQPSIWAHRQRIGLTVYWQITAGIFGPVLDQGTRRTKVGALNAAIAAAHDPNLKVGGAR